MTCFSVVKCLEPDRRHRHQHFEFRAMDTAQKLPTPPGIASPPALLITSETREANTYVRSAKKKNAGARSCLHTISRPTVGAVEAPVLLRSQPHRRGRPARMC